MKKRISVVIITYNRPKDVMETIESVLNQSCKPLEIIVIDDGSNPPLNATFDIEKLKLIRFDKELGLSGARNYGIKIAKGDYVAFIDDDAIADKHWLEEIQKGLKMKADILGGALKPIYEMPPPKWWNEKDFGSYAGVGNIWNRHIYGSNMIIKKEVFKKTGFFRTEMGRQKGKLLSSEETDFIERAVKRGYHVLFMPEAVVYHKVKPERMTFKYILKWEYYDGKSMKIKNGYKPLGTSFLILKKILGMANPCIIFSKKSLKIKKIAGLVNLFRQLV